MIYAGKKRNLIINISRQLLRVSRNAEKNNSDTQISGLLKWSPLVLGVVAYYSGWIYLNEYLGNFGLYLTNLDISVQYCILISYAPLISGLYDPIDNDLLWLFMLIISFITISVIEIKNGMMKHLLVISMFAIGLISINNLSTSAANKHANYVLNGGGKIISIAKRNNAAADKKDPFSSGIITELNESNERGLLRFVWQTNDFIYVAKSQTGCRKSNDCKGVAYRIPNESILYYRIIGNKST